MQMRILHTVQFYEPQKGGSEEVVRQLSERLAARGHQVTVATAYDADRSYEELDGVRVEAFKVSGNLVRGIFGEADVYRRFIQDRAPKSDVMLNYAAQIWSTDLVFDLHEGIPTSKVMVPCGYSELGNPAYANYFRDLPARLGAYDALVYMSESYQDKRFGDEAGLGDRAVVIPNGAAREEFDAPSPSFRKRYDITTPHMILTVANHHYLKGHRHLTRAFRRLGRTDTTLVIIGGALGRPWQGCYARCRVDSLINRRIRVVSEVPRDLVVAAYKEADVFVFASELECAPLVIYEAMAAGTPFVSTNCGNVRDHDNSGVIVDDPIELAGAIDDLLSDPSRREQLAETGRETWRRTHTWDSITDSYERLYQKLVQSK